MFLIWAPPSGASIPEYPHLSENSQVTWSIEENMRMQAYFYNDPKFPDARLEAAIRMKLNDPSTELTALELASITELSAMHYDIANLAGLEYCTGLQGLWLAYNNISDLGPLAGLTGLQTLVLNYNAISDVGPLENLMNLSFLSLEWNNITKLGLGSFGVDDWGLIANEGLGTGDSLYLDGNPLVAWALCEEAPVLEDRDVTVYGVEACDTDPESSGDQDADGFTNIEEMRYLRYYYNDPTLGEEPEDLYYLYLLFDTSPGITHQCFENLETVEVTVEVSGEGSVYLGDGYATEGNPKTWEFAKWEEGCPTLCSGGGTWPECSFNQITLVAEAAEGAVFENWQGDVSRSISSVTIKTVTNARTLALFHHIDQVAAMDLIGDFEEFLLEMEQGSVATYDANEIDYAFGGERVFVGNGIPDAAEFYMIEEVLEDPELRLRSSTGITYGALYDAWTANVAQAESDLELTEGQDGWIVHTVAAYMTLGDYGSRERIQSLVDDYYSEEGMLDDAAYDTWPARYLSADEDADWDSYSNRSEWEDVIAGSGPGDIRVDAAVYAAAGLDATATPSGGPSEGEGEGEAECTPDCRGSVTVTAKIEAEGPETENRGRLTIRAEGYDPLEVEGTAEVQQQYPVGTELEVQYTPDADYTFSHFQTTPSTLISVGYTTNRPGPMQDHFMVSETTEVTAVIKRVAFWIEDQPNPVVVELPGGTVILGTRIDLDGPVQQHGEAEDLGAGTILRCMGAPWRETVTATAIYHNPIRDPVRHWDFGPGGSEKRRFICPGAASLELWGNSGTPHNTPLRVDSEGPQVEYCISGNVSGGPGYVMAASGGSLSTGSPALGGAMVAWNGHVNLSAVPSHPDYFVDHWEWRDLGEGMCDGTWILLGGDGIMHVVVVDPGCTTVHYSTVRSDETFTAVLKKKDKFVLKLKRDVEGGTNPPQCAGYVTAEPAKKYYAGETVSINPIANPGYRFLKWDGTGDTASGAPIKDNTSKPLSVAMNDDFEITAVFALGDKPVRVAAPNPGEVERVKTALEEWNVEMGKDDDGEGTQDVTVCMAYYVRDSICSGILGALLPADQWIPYPHLYIDDIWNALDYPWGLAVAYAIGPFPMMENPIMNCRAGSPIPHCPLFYPPGTTSISGPAVAAQNFGWGGQGLQANENFNRTVAHELGHALVDGQDQIRHPDVYGPEELYEPLFRGMLNASGDFSRGDGLDHSNCLEAYLDMLLDGELPAGCAENQRNIMWFVYSDPPDEIPLDMWIKQDQLPWD